MLWMYIKSCLCFHSQLSDIDLVATRIPCSTCNKTIRYSNKDTVIITNRHHDKLLFTLLTKLHSEGSFCWTSSTTWSRDFVKSSSDYIDLPKGQYFKTCHYETPTSYLYLSSLVAENNTFSINVQIPPPTGSLLRFNGDEHLHWVVCKHSVAVYD